MKSAIAAFALTSALVAPGLAAARPVTFTTTLNNYGGDGAYLVLYLTDAAGRYAGTLWVAGGKSKYYDSLAGWYRATGGDPAQIDGITGASVGAGRTLEITLDLADALFDAAGCFRKLVPYWRQSRQHIGAGDRVHPLLAKMRIDVLAQ